MLENPWLRLPDRPPYVLPDDEPLVLAFNEKAKARPKHVLRVDAYLPEAFVGCADAPVVLLSNNPGCSDEKSAYKREAAFVRRLRENLTQAPSTYPFFYLRPDLDKLVPRWWRKKLKHLLGRFDLKVIARSLLNVPYFPYPSEKYGWRGTPLPSQEYGFHLVREAMQRKALIVFMRKGEGWKTAIPKLARYDRVRHVLNYQNPVLSPNFAGFEDVVEAIAARDDSTDNRDAVRRRG